MKLDRSKIERATAEAGLTRYQLLDALGISEATIYRWLRGDAPRVAVLALCYVLRVKPQGLTAEEGGGR